MGRPVVYGEPMAGAGVHPPGLHQAPHEPPRVPTPPTPLRYAVVGPASHIPLGSVVGAKVPQEFEQASNSVVWNAKYFLELSELRMIRRAPFHSVIFSVKKIGR